jgi:hypothetical protein
MEGAPIADVPVGHLHVNALFEAIEPLIEDAPLRWSNPASTEVLLEPLGAW